MTWSLSAAGHAITSQGETWYEETKALEEKLVAELKAVLSKPEYGTSSSNIAGNAVSGQVHETPAPPAADSSAPTSN